VAALAKVVDESEVATLRNEVKSGIVQQNFERAKDTEIYSLMKATTLGKAELDNLFFEFSKVSTKDTVEEEGGTGYIEFSHFAQILPKVLPRWGKDKNTVQWLWEAFDKNKDNKLEYKELSLCLSTLYHGTIDDKLKFCFNVYDFNKNGKLEKEELRAMLANVKRRTRLLFNLDRVVERTFKTLDVDNDNHISFDEFKQIIYVEPSLSQFFLPPEQLTKVNESHHKVDLVIQKKKCSIM